MSMRTIEPWRQKTFGTSFRSTTTIAVTIAVFGLGAITVGAVTHSPPKRVATGGAIMAHWSEPTNEVNAPFIPIIGGASSISGGFNAVTCTSQLNCIAVGADNALGGVVSSTGDGGNDWSQSSTAVGQPVLNAVSCATSSLCIAVGQGASARSTDGGTTWTTFAVPTANTTLLGVQCPSSTACVSVGVRPGRNAPLTGQVLVSSNGGQTWTTPTLPKSVGALGAVDCPTTSLCVSVGASILVSTNGGSSWSPRYVNGGTGVLRSVSCVSATTCVAIGPNPAGAQDPNASAYEVVTTNGGATWTSEPMPAGSADIDAISCSSNGTCDAVGASTHLGQSFALTSTNSGSTWSSATNLASAATAVSAVTCSSSGCVAVGKAGKNAVSITGTSTGIFSSHVVSRLVRAQRGNA